MIRPTVAIGLALCCGAGQAHADAAPCVVRLAYVDQQMQPYYMGEGEAIPDPPGAGVELAQALVASAGCTIKLSRMPQKRVESALAAGEIDMALLGAHAATVPSLAYPRAKGGELDRQRSMKSYTIAFVRAADKLPQETDPASYFVGRRLGTMYGAPFAAIFREAGVLADDGALDHERNFNKLLLGRVDGYAASLTNPADLDAYVRTKYGTKVVRLQRPMRVAYLYLASNRSYYDANRTAVEAMWRFMGSHGAATFTVLMKKYPGPT